MYSHMKPYYSSVGYSIGARWPKVTEMQQGIKKLLKLSDTKQHHMLENI